MNLESIMPSAESQRQILYNFTHMRDLNNKTDEEKKIKQEQTNTQAKLVVTREEGVLGLAKWVKKVNCVVMDDAIHGGDQFVVCTDVEL